jgi:hypothetical protein
MRRQSDIRARVAAVRPSTPAVKPVGWQWFDPGVATESATGSR